MAVVAIRCPKTGEIVSSGIESDAASLGRRENPAA